MAAKEGDREIEARFQRRLEEFEGLAVDLWTAAPTRPADIGPKRSLWSRWRSGRSLSGRVEQFRSRLAAGSADELMRDDLTGLGRELVSRMGLGQAAGNLLTRSDMTRATEEFARQARDEDPDLAAEDLGQALRNVWVIHFFQLLHAGSARHTQASLGYSLLYPYTDNALDDPSRSTEQKRARSKRLGLRLGGIPLPPLDTAEARVFQQLDRIDHDFPRVAYPELHLSLQAIHRGQVASLQQQNDQALDDTELLRLSVAKGGSSVLVDAYLAAGRPAPEMARFAFVYGVALQLADDLQDVETDLAAGHQTLFTRAARRGRLEPQFWRLVHFLDASLEACPSSGRGVPGPAELTGSHLESCDLQPCDLQSCDLKALARASMVHLMVQAVGAQPGYFPRSLRRRLARHSPVTFGRARSLRRRLARLLNVSF